MNIGFRIAHKNIALSSWRHLSKSLKNPSVVCSAVAIACSVFNQSPVCAQYNPSDSVHRGSSDKVSQPKAAVKSIFIPGCESTAANKVPRPTQAPTDKTLQAKQVQVRGAQVCKMSRSENKLYLTFQGILGDVVESKNADFATRNSDRTGGFTCLPRTNERPQNPSQQYEFECYASVLETRWLRLQT